MIAIRPARDGDARAIRAVHEAAFGQPAEGRLVDALAACGHVALSLVADLGVAIVGHVLLSCLGSPHRSLALAPLAVLPSNQSQRVGNALVRAATEQAKAGGYDAIFVLGDPAYYGRFGFSAEAARPFPCAYAGEHFMAIMLTGAALTTAPVIYPPPFAALG